MKNILRICMVQADLIWEDKKSNLLLFDHLLNTKNESSDLIILPEMFNTGFTMKAFEMAESSNSLTIQWMREKAIEYNAVITGSLIYKENNSFFNRLIWMRPDGSYDSYDKRHLFRMGGEKDHYSGGKTKLITELHGWRVCPLICYDLRFPVWSRNREEYDFLFYIASWPASRRLVWDTLLRARAIENQAYVCGVNRIGQDGEGIKYNGGTVIFDPKGNELFAINDNQQKAGICEISLPLLNKFRNAFPV